MNTEQSNASDDAFLNWIDEIIKFTKGTILFNGGQCDELQIKAMEQVRNKYLSLKQKAKPIKVFNVSDNCNAFRDWLRENNIPFISNGAFTSFDLKEDIFSIGKRYGVYEYLNKPAKVEPIINETELQKDMDEWDEQNKHRSGQAQIDLGNMGNFSSSYEPIKDEELREKFNRLTYPMFSKTDTFYNRSDWNKVLGECVELSKRYSSSIQNNSAGVWVKASERLPKTKGHYITKRPTLNEGERIIKDEIFNPKYSDIGEKWISFRYKWLDESKQK